MSAFSVVSGLVGIGDPNNPGNVLKPNADGGLGSGIASVFRLLSAAGTTQDANNVKTTAGRVYYIHGRNNRASSVFLKLYNKATAPAVGTDVPVDTIELIASQPFIFDFPAGLAFTTGIGFGLVTAVADNSTASVTAGDITALGIGYT